MANPEHVEVVRQGKDAIDQWQNAHPDQRLDLVEADLIGVVLIGADFFQVDLSKANLPKANLSQADLSGANLSQADLSDADLSGADLSGAILDQANLTAARLVRSRMDRAHLFEANLSEADLTETNLSKAVLSLANLSVVTLNQTHFFDAEFGWTVFGDCDLSEALGLESVIHAGPSTIGLDTIVKSGGNIPDVFLRGCGVPDSIITYVRSLVAEPIQFYTCFISYAHQDEAFADRLHADLQAKGVRCWYYPENSVMGRRVWEDIDRSINVYDKLVVICSEASLNSPAVVEEVERALGKEETLAKENAQRRIDAAARGEEPRLRDTDVLFPIRIDDFVLNSWDHHRKSDVTGRNIGDFVGWDTDVQKYQDSLNRLLHALDPKSWPAVG